MAGGAGASVGRRYAWFRGTCRSYAGPARQRERAVLPEMSVYLYPSRGSLRFRCGNTATERPIFQTCGHGETDEDIVTRNSRRGSKFVRKTRQEGLLFAPTPRV